MITEETNLADISRHVNNYFTAGNKPKGKRKYPPEFLELAKRILAYRNSPQGQPTNIVGETVAGFHKWQAATIDGLPADWTQVFKKELAVYRRVKFI